MQQDVVLVDTGDGGNKSLPMSGYALAHVLYLFSFQYAHEHFPRGAHVVVHTQ